jgi:hypothetical protein
MNIIPLIYNIILRYPMQYICVHETLFIVAGKPYIFIASSDTV